jgi:Membrane MotB of proton-channel complex MotA/MotB
MADNQEPIVVKRVKKVVGGHGGGVWKIAYADFVTAMMAFFLLARGWAGFGRYQQHHQGWRPADL